MFTFEWFSCPDGITPNSGLTGPNNTYIYICVCVCVYVCVCVCVWVYNGESKVFLYFGNVALFGSSWCFCWYPEVDELPLDSKMPTSVIPNYSTLSDVHLCSFQIINGMKQHTKCQHTDNLDTIKHSEYSHNLTCFCLIKYYKTFDSHMYFNEIILINIFKRSYLYIRKYEHDKHRESLVYAACEKISELKLSLPR